MAIYLLIKEHTDTGLKYLCKHVANSFSECEEYSGSGTYWKRHIKKYGNKLKTTYLFHTDDKEEFKKIAKEYSIKFDVVNSKEWANLCYEEGQGGNTVFNSQVHGEKTKIGQNKPEVKQKMLLHLERQIKIIQPLAAAAAKKKLKGIPKSEEVKQKMRGKRPHVNQTGGNNNNAKKIETPFGIFNSIRDASKQLKGFSYFMIWERIQKNNDWRYIK
jgi:hypothetical protein